MAYWSEAERLFYDEVREKKTIGRGIFSQKGKGKKHGTYVSLPSDRLTASQKKKLNGKCEVSNMYQSLTTYEEFQRNPEHMQKIVLEKWREFHTNDTIIEALGIGKKRFYDLLEELDITKKRRGGSTPMTTMTPIPKEGILSLGEFKQLSEEEQKETLTRYRNTFLTKDIQAAWGMSTGTFYKCISDLGLPTSGPNTSKKEEPINMARQLGTMDILPYKKFQRLPQIQQKELLDNYKRRFPNQKDLAEEWGISPTTIYGLSNRLKNVQYTPTSKEDIIKAKPEPVIEEVPKQESIQEPKQTLIEFVEQITPELVPEPVEETTEPIEPSKELEAEPTKPSKELEELEDQLAKLTEQLARQSQQIEQLQTATLMEPAPIPTQAAPTPLEPKQAEGFAMQYEKTAEGFLTHVEIKRFISVLEKNPDTFNVKISITKIED